MSRNRGTTGCACGFWNFAVHGDALAPTDATLMTGEEYQRLIGSRYEPGGHYFRDDLNGTVFYIWESPNGMGHASHHRDGWERRISARYSSVPESERYRWAKLTCPLCLRVYVGWFVKQPWIVEPTPDFDDSMYREQYEVVDLSYFSTFNDEPGDDDIRDVFEWTPGMVAEALREYRERQG